jgi:hypothetical protein
VHCQSPPHPLYRPSSTAGLSSRPPAMCFQLPPFTLVFGQHAINFFPTVVIPIVCFPCFSFGCFSDFACICLFFRCYFPVRFLLFVPFIWLYFCFCPFISLYIFSFLFLLVIRLYLSNCFLPMSISAFGSDLWVVDVNNILTFGLRMMSIGLGVFCSQG